MNCWKRWQKIYFHELFIDVNILKIKLKLEKTQIIKNTSSVGIEISKKRL